MNRLEARYRRVLRVLPRSYREAWEEDMVASFLDSNQTGDAEIDEYTADYGRPAWSEVASVLALAVRMRLGGEAAPPRSCLWGQAVRLAVLAASLTLATVATGQLLIMFWATGRIAWLPQPPADWMLPSQPSVWSTASMLAGCAWAAPYLALVLGHRQIAQALALLSVGGALVADVSALSAGEPPRVQPLVHLLIGLVLVAAMAAFHSDAPVLTSRGWVLAFGVGVVVAVPALLLIQWASGLGVVYTLDPAGLSCVLVAAAAAAHLLRQGPRPGRSQRAWTLALALLAAVALVQRLAVLPDQAGQPGSAAQITVGLIQAAVVVAVGVPLLRAAYSALRRTVPG